MRAFVSIALASGVWQTAEVETLASDGSSGFSSVPLSGAVSSASVRATNARYDLIDLVGLGWSSRVVIRAGRDASRRGREN